MQRPVFACFVSLSLTLPSLLAAAAPPDADQLDKMAARFAPTDLTADISKLSASERSVLVKLIEAAKIVDGLFLRQAWNGNVSMMLDLTRDETPTGRARLHYFRIN